MPMQTNSRTCPNQQPDSGRWRLRITDWTCASTIANLPWISRPAILAFNCFVGFAKPDISCCCSLAAHALFPALVFVRLQDNIPATCTFRPYTIHTHPWARVNALMPLTTMRAVPYMVFIIEGSFYHVRPFGQS